MRAIFRCAFSLRSRISLLFSDFVVCQISQAGANWKYRPILSVVSSMISLSTSFCALPLRLVPHMWRIPSWPILFSTYVPPLEWKKIHLSWAIVLHSTCLLGPSQLLTAALPMPMVKSESFYLCRRLLSGNPWEQLVFWEVNSLWNFGMRLEGQFLVPPYNVMPVALITFRLIW
jgi:hypothetical protein